MDKLFWCLILPRGEKKLLPSIDRCKSRVQGKKKKNCTKDEIFLLYSIWKVKTDTKSSKIKHIDGLFLTKLLNKQSVENNEMSITEIYFFRKPTLK